MSIATVFAHVSVSDLSVSRPWYEKLFGIPITRSPMAGLVEFHFTDSAEVQVFESKQDAGHSTLTLGVLPMEPERARLVAAGLAPGEIEEASHGLYIMRLRDPDGNLVVFASAARR